MLKEIENIIKRPLSLFEEEKLKELQQNYSDSQIIDCYKNSSVLHINYIRKLIANNYSNCSNKNKKINEPNWLNKDIKKDMLTLKEYDNLYNNFYKTFVIFFSSIEEFKNKIDSDRKEILEYWSKNKC